MLEAQAPDPPSRRRSRCLRRRAARLPPQTNGVGERFQCSVTASNQPMICSGVPGCWPSSARRLRIRCRLSTMFSHDPPRGVYNGMIPMRKQPLQDERGRLVADQVVQHQEHPQRRQLVGSSVGLIVRPACQRCHAERSVNVGSAKLLALAPATDARTSVSCSFEPPVQDGVGACR